MFGDLFGEEDESSPPGTGKDKEQKSSRNAGLSQPPPLRGRTGLAGIANQGATCYLNSLLQTLLFTPEFRGTVANISWIRLLNLPANQ